MPHARNAARVLEIFLVVNIHQSKGSFQSLFFYFCRMKSKKDRTMADVSKGYAEFIKGKENNKNGKNKFDKALKKAIKKKQPGSK